MAELKNAQLAYVEASEYYRQAAELIPQGEKKHLATYLNMQGLSLLYAGKYLAAETPLRRSLEIRKQALGPDHPNVATSLNNLAFLYRATERGKEALVLEKRATRIKAIKR